MIWHPHEGYKIPNLLICKVNFQCQKSTLLVWKWFTIEILKSWTLVIVEIIWPLSYYETQRKLNQKSSCPDQFFWAKIYWANLCSTIIVILSNLYYTEVPNTYLLEIRWCTYALYAYNMYTMLELLSDKVGSLRNLSPKLSKIVEMFSDWKLLHSWMTL